MPSPIVLEHIGQILPQDTPLDVDDGGQYELVPKDPAPKTSKSVSFQIDTNEVPFELTDENSEVDERDYVEGRAPRFFTVREAHVPVWRQILHGFSLTFQSLKKCLCCICETDDN